MPSLVEPTEEVGSLRPELQQKFGLKKQIKVFVGGADNACVALGAGILTAETGLVSIGTSGVFLKTVSDKSEAQKSLHFFRYVVSKSYYLMEVMLVAGHSLNWFKETFTLAKSFEELLSRVDEVLLGSLGLFFNRILSARGRPILIVRSEEVLSESIRDIR